MLSSIPARLLFRYILMRIWRIATCGFTLCSISYLCIERKKMVTMLHLNNFYGYIITHFDRDASYITVNSFYALTVEIFCATIFNASLQHSLRFISYTSSAFPIAFNNNLQIRIFDWEELQTWNNILTLIKPFHNFLFL